MYSFILQAMSTEAELARVQFAHHVQRALSALYDPAVLNSSVLTVLLGIEAENDPASVLQQTLIGMIESLKPNEPTPPGSRGWRVYQVLRRRYTEQLTQHEVAVNLGMSIRQLQREEKIAREVIADRLWAAHNVGAKLHLLPSTSTASHTLPGEDQATDPAAPSAAEELETLSKSTPVQVVQIGEVIREVLDTLQPILSAACIKVEFSESNDLPPVAVKVPMLRQALFNIVSVAARMAIDDRLLVKTFVETFVDTAQVCVCVRSMCHPRTGLEEQGSYAETLDMGRQLLEFCNARLRISPPDDSCQEIPPSIQASAFIATVEFPVAEVYTVLVVDDNADARQLMQRYLHGTPYQFVGAADAYQALTVLQQVTPNAIVLDVMMPKQDGWTLLGQLRNLPTLHGVPIIVSTIVPQKDLAYALGAAEFIRKPIKRPELLAALARHLGQPTGSPSSR